MNQMTVPRVSAITRVDHIPIEVQHGLANLFLVLSFALLVPGGPVIKVSDF